MLISLSATLILFNTFRTRQNPLEPKNLLMNRGLLFTTAFACFVYTHPEIVLTIFTLSVTLFCTFTAISIFLYYYNRQQLQAAMNKKLTIRYQYKENVTTLTFLVPMLTAFGLSNIISALLIIYMFVNITAYGVGIKLVDNLWKIEKAYNATVSVYTIFFVGIFVKLHRPIWDQFLLDLKWIFGIHQRSVPIQHKSSRVRLVGRDGKLVEAATEGDVYFKSLKETWS
uniref:Uncharacterized protein n=1 Tax=Panagrolaimus sp. JU765 TaxID=591449 RepID=A0AC34R9C5_9BILA